MARKHWRNGGEGRNTTTSTSYGDQVACTFTPQLGSTDHFVIWSALADHSATTSDNRHRLYDDTAAAALSGVCNVEPRDTTDKWSVGGIAKWTSPSSPVSQTFSVEFSAEAGTSGSAAAAILVLEKVSSDQYAESNGDSTTTDTTTDQDKTTLTFTPATLGTYLILASAEINGSSSSAPPRILLDINGVDYFVNSAIQSNDNSNYIPWAAALTMQLAAVSNTIKIQYRSTGLGTITIRNARILAIRMDSFDAAQSDYTQGRITNSTVNYADAASTTVNPMPGNTSVDVLLIGAGVMDSSNSGYSAYTRRLNGANSYHESLREPTANTHEMPYFSVSYDYNASTASMQYRVQYCIENALATAGIAERFVAALIPDDFIRSNDVPSLALTVSAKVPTVEIVESGATVTVPLTSLTVTANAPVVGADIVLEPGVKALTVTPAAPGVATDTLIGVPASALSITPAAPVVSADTPVAVPLTALTVTAQLPTLILDAAALVPVAPLTVTAFAPTPETATDIGSVALTVTAHVPVVDVTAAGGATVDAPTATLTVTAAVPYVVVGRYIDGDYWVFEYVDGDVAFIELPVPSKALSLAVFAPTLESDVAVPSKALTLAAYAPSVAVDTITAAPAASLSLTAQTPAIAIDALVAVPLAALALSAKVPAAFVDPVLSVGVTSLTVTLYAPSVAIDVVLAVPLVSLSLSALVPAIATDTLVGVPSTALAVSPLAPFLILDAAVEVPPTALVITLPEQVVVADKQVQPGAVALQINLPVPTVGYVLTTELSGELSLEAALGGTIDTKPALDGSLETRAALSSDQLRIKVALEGNLGVSPSLTGT